MTFQNTICVAIVFVVGVCGGIAFAQSRIRIITIEKNSTVKWIIPDDIARIQLKSVMPNGAVLFNRSISVLPGQIMYISTNQ